MSFFEQLSDKKQSEYKKSDIEEYHTDMSLRLVSPLALPYQLRATLLIPIIDLSVVAKHMIDFTRCFTEMLVGFICLSPLRALDRFAGSLEELGVTLYFAISAITDTVSALITLGMRTVGTVATVGNLAVLTVGLAFSLFLTTAAMTFNTAYSLGCTALGCNNSLAEIAQNQPAP